MSSYLINTDTKKALGRFADAAAAEAVATLGTYNYVVLTDDGDIDQLTGPEMVEVYNTLTGAQTSRFSTKGDGFRRLMDALEAHDFAVVPVKTKKEKVVKPRLTPEQRSESMKGSWANKEVAAARSARHHVAVNETEYRSVKEAFEKLGLPLKKHIPFRARLKAEGKAVFEHQGLNYTFLLVTKEGN